MSLKRRLLSRRYMSQIEKIFNQKGYSVKRNVPLEPLKKLDFHSKENEKRKKRAIERYKKFLNIDWRKKAEADIIAEKEEKIGLFHSDSYRSVDIEVAKLWKKICNKNNIKPAIASETGFSSKSETYCKKNNIMTIGPEIIKKRYLKNRYKLIQYLYGKILDIGSAQGEFHEYITSTRDQAYGLDLTKVPQENLVLGKAQQMPFREESFDSIFAGEIIEHLEDPFNLLLEAKRVLKKNGVIVCTTPNGDRLPLRSIINSLGKTISSRSEGNQHLYKWDITNLRRLFKKAEFEIIEEGYTTHTPPEKVWRKVLFRNFPMISAGSIYIVALKNS